MPDPASEPGIDSAPQPGWAPKAPARWDDDHSVSGCDLAFLMSVRVVLCVQVSLSLPVFVSVVLFVHSEAQLGLTTCMGPAWLV